MKRLKWKLISSRLEIVLMLMRDGCTVGVECTKGSDIILQHSMELLGDVGLVESCFSLFRDGVNVGAR